MKISVIMPAYNACRHIDSVLYRFPSELKRVIRHIYIINDGSTDETHAFLDALSLNEKTIVPVHFETNRGYGNAVREGLNRCRKDGCDFAACIHADGQYPPESVCSFVSHMQLKNIDIMQGSRIASGTALQGGMPLYKYIAGTILTALENQVLHLKLTDYHSGFLVYNRKALSTLRFEQLSYSFDFDLEVLASACHAGLKVGELPIPTRYATEHSYLNPVTYGIRVLRVLFRFKAGYYHRCLAEPC
jgi:glycosyltransferase involved in cell wall biosynthesis